MNSMEAGQWVKDFAERLHKRKRDPLNAKLYEAGDEVSTLLAFFCGVEVSFTDKVARLGIPRIIENFKALLTSQCSSLITEIWEKYNEILFSAIQKTSVDEQANILFKVLASHSKLIIPYLMTLDENKIDVVRTCVKKMDGHGRVAESSKALLKRRLIDILTQLRKTKRMDETPILVSPPPKRQKSLTLEEFFPDEYQQSSTSTMEPLEFSLDFSDNSSETELFLTSLLPEFPAGKWQAEPRRSDSQETNGFVRILKNMGVYAEKNVKPDDFTFVDTVIQSSRFEM